MKLVWETEIFNLVNGNESGTDMMAEILKQMRNVTTELDYDLRTIEKVFKNPLTVKTMEDIRNGNIIPFVSTNPSKTMPPWMPFIKFGDPKTRAPKVAVDLSLLATVREDKVNEEFSVSIDRKKLYVLLISAYIYLHFADKTMVLPTNLMTLTASVWAKMFCKILDRKVGLATNNERREAFLYFAAKYYLLNILETTENIAEGIALGMFKNKIKNSIAKEVEVKINDRGIDLYSNLSTFVGTLFNNDITGLRSIRIKNSSSELNLTYYMKEFMSYYYSPSGFAVAAFPFFMWMIISANNWAYIFNDKAIEDISKEEFPKIMVELYKLAK